MPHSPMQIAGVALEEAILAVLDRAGFRRLCATTGDLTLVPGRPPVTIRGRGASHQIDAVADPVVAYPFSNPARLLVEAKAYSEDRPVDLPIVRNAVGTVKDLSEYWRPVAPERGAMRRYHYRYAIFATTRFTKPAQEYAYAQDVHLLPLRRSAFFRPITEAVDDLRHMNGANEVAWFQHKSLSSFRRELRRVLRGNAVGDSWAIQRVADAVRQVRAGLVAMAGRAFPLFLVPRSIDVLESLDDVETVRIFWDQDGWYLRRRGDGTNLFSFDLPDELLSMYAKGGGLEQEAALRMKTEQLGVIQAFYTRSGTPRLVHFLLDGDWIRQLLRA